MVGETVQFDQAATGADDKKREQSTIAFPYVDLNAARETATAVYSRSGFGSCDLDELAAELGQVIGGAFRLKTGAAKVFDLIEKDGRSGVKLTELGKAIVAEDTERAAKAEAFMRVPLYAAIYEKYKGQKLPPMKALEREMLALGVSSKQTDKARQAFERSARQAGFFDAGEDRLVRPKAEMPAPKGEQFGDGGKAEERQRERDRERGNGGGGGGGGGGKDHPLIKGLMVTLPEPDGEWDMDGRKAWLKMAASIFDMIYKKPKGGTTTGNQQEIDIDKLIGGDENGD